MNLFIRLNCLPYPKPNLFKLAARKGFAPLQLRSERSMLLLHHLAKMAAWERIALSIVLFKGGCVTVTLPGKKWRIRTNKKMLAVFCTGRLRVDRIRNVWTFSPEITRTHSLSLSRSPEFRYLRTVIGNFLSSTRHKLVPPPRLALGTNRLKGDCSTIELRRLKLVGLPGLEPRTKAL